MRGIDEKPSQLFSYVDPERRIAPDHVPIPVLDKPAAIAGVTRTVLWMRIQLYQTA
jgi:hypothetical protein